jgi:addiction module HigA family antidote
VAEVSLNTSSDSSQNRLDEIVHATRRISADTALRPARYFGTSDGFWLNLPSHYDLEVERGRQSGSPDPLADARMPFVVF